MKKIILFTALLATTAFIWMSFTENAAGGGPEKVAKKFLKAFEAGDWEDAGSYCTEKGKSVVDLLGSVNDNPAGRKPIIVGTQMIGSSEANVTYQLKGSNEEKTLKLLFLEGEWKVAATKEDMPSRHESVSGSGKSNSGSFDFGTEPSGKVVKAGKPSKVAKNFLEAMEEEDFETAKKYATPKTQETIDLIGSFNDETSAPARKVTILREESLEKDKSVVFYRLDDGEEQFVGLIKMGKEWKVSTTKENLRGQKTEDSLQGALQDLEKSLEDALDSLETVPDSL